MAQTKPADNRDGKFDDNGHKKVDPLKPFHRINSPDVNASGTSTVQFKTADGDGFFRSAGPDTPRCRRKPPLALLNTLAHLVTGALFRTIPAWVPVQRAAFKELEGRLVRSFQTWTDFPLFQWHRWYDWNFHVEPDPGYEYLRGAGNAPENLGGKRPVVSGDTMECEWDTGAFGRAVGQAFGPGPMFIDDWVWPMAGQHVWIAGEWIYDCGHTNSKELMRTELHPCHFVANARWEAVRFQADSKVAWPVPGTGSDSLGSDTLFLPAIQFMFFASRLGGYHDFPALNNRNYKFIVDLPKIKLGAGASPVGPEPNFSENSIVLGHPKLVFKFDQGPFQRQARTDTGRFAVLAPIVTAIEPGDGTAPTQAIVEIPLDTLPDLPLTDAYGVVVSLGWVDTDPETLRLLAKRVVKCTVTCDKLLIFNARSGHWAFKVGVNGRWQRIELTNLKTGQSRSLNKTFQFMLSLDHPTPSGGEIRISTHGKSFRPVGDFFANNDGNARTVRFFPLSQGGRVVEWEQDIVRGTNDTAEGVASQVAVKLALTANLQNEALGIVDFFTRVSDVNTDPNARAPRLEGRTLQEVPEAAELVDGDLVQTSGGGVGVPFDYFLECTIQIDPQVVP